MKPKQEAGGVEEWKSRFLVKIKNALLWACLEIVNENL